jgi:hypothetical protein
MRVERLVRFACDRLGVVRPVEVFQKAGPAHHLNATTHRSHDGPILIQFRGALLDRLEDTGVIAVLGHELGHHLAHGPASVDAIDPFFLYWRLARSRRVGYRELAAAYCRAAELTADRFGLLACGDLGAVVRMEAAFATDASMSGDALERLRASRDYAEALRVSRGRGAGDSHPEQAIRIYAAWLFFESDLYRAITGAGSGSKPIADVDHVLGRLVRPSESAEDMGLPPEGDPCIADRARDALDVARERASALLAGRRSTSSQSALDPEIRAALRELDADPLEEKFRALERRTPK